MAHSTITYLKYLCRAVEQFDACRVGTAFIIHAVPISYFVAIVGPSSKNMTECIISNKETANVAAANISVSRRRKHYWLYSDDAFFDSLIKFFPQNEQEPLHAFTRKQNMNRSTFCCFFIESGLQKVKESETIERRQ